MKTVCKENMCTGCMACVDVCPKSAIKMSDSLNAYNAIIDTDKCIECDSCFRVCQNNNNLSFNKSIAWFQGWAKDEKIRGASSSGGIATELIKTFLLNYGTVCSCVFKNGVFGFEFAENISEYDKFKGSKYVKSNPEGIYRKVKQKLSLHENVLFVGLPCQVAAVKLFVGEKLQEHLYTVDLICHGSPSPKLLEKFLEEYNFSLNNINEINFRKKNKFHLYKEFVGVEPERVNDTYTHAFLNCLDYTENCYSCKYARSERISDITIGDSWGSELSEDEQNKGISLILCQTEKGNSLIKQADLTLIDVDLEKAISNNTQLRHPSSVPDSRELFFNTYKKSNNFGKSVKKCYPKVFFKQDIKKILIKCKIIRGESKIDYRIRVKL